MQAEMSSSLQSLTEALSQEKRGSKSSLGGASLTAVERRSSWYRALLKKECEVETLSLQLESLAVRES